MRFAKNIYQGLSKVSLVTLVVALLGSILLVAARQPDDSFQRNKPEGLIQLAQDVDLALLAKLKKEGKPLFSSNCAPCHGEQAEGGDGPKLVGNDYLVSLGAVVVQIMKGDYEHGMPAFEDSFNDREIAAVATFIRNSWNNEYGIVTPERVARFRGL